MSIRINDLTVRFKNGVVAVNKASLEIPKGIYGLLGENGAGKTTFYLGKCILFQFYCFFRFGFKSCLKI